MKKVVVIIPIYQTELNSFEKTSLQRCLLILKNHPIVIITPNSLDTHIFREEYGIEHIECFDDAYFDGLDGYNRLMLSPEFYRRFLEYTYMLIYQLDAYVFCDLLSEWCDKGYDYVGAPWIPSDKYNKLYHKTELSISKYIYRLLSLYSSRSNYYHTGNGGFSLRKIETFYQITLSDQEQIKKFLKNSSPHYAEDIYWAIHANRLIKKRLIIPHYSEALAFAFENHPEKLFHNNNQQLPFGAHAWYKGDRRFFWQKYIPCLQMPSASDPDTTL